MKDFQTFIDLAGRLADTSGPILSKYFRSGTEIIDKPDASPVTVADRKAEAAMRGLIHEAFPDHGIIGEEHGAQNADAEYVWVIDPIDGTKAFVTGKPLFGTCIALCQQGVPVIGIIDQPILGERWAGAKGQHTTFNGEPVRTRGCKDLADAWLYATTPDMFETDEEIAAFGRVRKAVKHPLFGADCYAYGLLSMGYADLVVEASLQPYDYLAHVPIIEGAGGKITDWQDQPLTIGSGSRVVAAGTAELHGKAISALKGGE